MKGIIKALIGNPNEERKSAGIAVQMEATAGIEKKPGGGGCGGERVGGGKVIDKEDLGFQRNRKETDMNVI